MSRWTYLAKRILMSIPVVLFGTSLTFIILYAGPINPAAVIAGKNASLAEIRQVEAQLGLDKPLWGQYFQFMNDLLLFDLGQSWVIAPSTNTYELIMIHVPRTLWLGAWAVTIPLFIGIPLGFYSGLNANTWRDYASSFGGIMWRSMPNFWLAVILLAGLSDSEEILFGFDWEMFIVETGVVGPPDLNNLTDPNQFVAATKRILPASLVLGSASLGNELRIARTAVLENLNANYVETARAKGLSNRLIVWKHIFRNALIPLVPVITAEAYLLIGGSVLVEEVFAINGLGNLFFDAMLNGDIPLAGVLMYFSILLLVGINILQDILYTIIDPRVGYEAR